MSRHWSLRLGTALCATLLLVGCTGTDEPQPPAPEVTTEEFERRLGEHLTRVVAGALEPEAVASMPAYSRAGGCADLWEGGPDWGVRPRAEITISAGQTAEKYFDDVETWAVRHDFGERENRWRVGTPEDIHEVSLVHEDGSRFLMEMPRNSAQFTVALTGPCTWPPDRSGGPPPSGQLPPLPAPHGPSEAMETGSEDEACRSPKLYVYNPAARPYAGPGPHPMALVDVQERERTFEYAELLLPDAWQPKDDSRTSRPDLKQVQLMVCVRAEPTRNTGRKVTCHYTNEEYLAGGRSPFTFNVFESVYHVTVREARSGRRITGFTVSGGQGDEESCPYRMYYNRTLARGIDEAAFQRKLRPLFGAAR